MRPAFSLLELMIAIVILGLGMIMVATMFPVAWSRARELNDFTLQRTAVAASHATVKSLVHVAGPAFTTAGFAGDLIRDPSGKVYAAQKVAWPSDTWVHALNMENIQVQDRAFVDEDPWSIENVYDLERDLDAPPLLVEASYANKQIRFHQRVYPPMVVRDNVDSRTGRFTDDDDAWDNQLDTRRFSSAVFHRLRRKIEPTAAGAGETRLFDMYYVTLRRSRPTFRYARQDPGAGTPNPYDLSATLVTPQPMDPDQDVMFPVPWRVQVEFPSSLVDCEDDEKRTGLPTEIEVPPTMMSATPEIKQMLVQMFQRGTKFIDEVSGQVYRVVRRRVVGPDGDKAVVTLDREVCLQEIQLHDNDPRCGTIVCEEPAAFPIRTVWVFPPPVEARAFAGDPLVFTGSQPVVEIVVRSLAVSPGA